jgi:hypothetical protein
MATRARWQQKPAADRHSGGRKGHVYGAHSPWAWALEPVRGCNLTCWHCAARLLPRNHYSFMSEETWRALFTIIRAVTPRCRVEMAQMGEPTLHPRLLDFLRIARALSPDTQLQVTTNGTQLIEGTITYRDLFDAGANVLYVDMYAPRDRHIALAEASGIRWAEYLKQPDDFPSPWTYHGPKTQIITLMENPSNWPQTRKSLNRLGTFFNHIDWAAAMPRGMVPVTEPITAYCAQPFKYAVVAHTGDYVLCCQDFMGETQGQLGNVAEGVEGFKRFWFGATMQTTREYVVDGNRGGPQCSRCSITFSTRGKGLFKRTWGPLFGQYWDGGRWRPTSDAPPAPAPAVPAPALPLTVLKRAPGVAGASPEADRAPGGLDP